MRVDLQVIGFEKAVLGTVLHDPETMDETVDLFPQDFTGGHQILWAEICRLYEYDRIDMRALIESLRSNGNLEEIASYDGDLTGENYILSLPTYRGTAMRTFVEGVLNASLKRQLRQVAALIMADAEDERVGAQDATDEAERRLIGLRRSRMFDAGVPISQILSVFNNRIEGMREGTIQPEWVPEILALKDVVSYFDRDDYIIFAARPGEGKSSILRYELARSAASGTPSLIINMENGELEYAKFLISLWTGIDSDRLKNPRQLSRAEVERAKEAARELSTLPLYVKTMASPTSAEVERAARLHVSQYGVRRIAVDYIQLIRNGIENRVQDVSLTSSMLRGIPLRYHVPLAAASQLSRNIVHRGSDANPDLADLRESGSLEQDATMVIFPRRLWHEPSADQLMMFPENIGERGNLLNVIKAEPIRLHVAKNRNGGIGVSDPVLWIKSTNNFRTLVRE